MLNTVGGGCNKINIYYSTAPTYINQRGNVFLLIDVDFITAQPWPAVFSVGICFIYLMLILLQPPPTVFSMGMYFF
jgi:hypothetical protein